MIRNSVRPTARKTFSMWRIGKVFASMLLSFGKCEEESILTGASVIDYGRFDSSYTTDPSEILGNGFKGYLFKYVS